MSQPVYDEAGVYPNYVIRKPDFSQSNGHEYGPVFIVLGVIVLISVVACAVGRFCNRQKEGHHHNKAVNYHQAERPPKVDQADKNKSVASQLGPGEWESTQRAPIFKLRDRGDVELEFDKRTPSTRMPANMVAPPHYNGGDKPHVRFADNV